MRIAYISAGAAGMYCGACIHDNTLVSRLIDMGHDAALVPIYTPTRTDEENVSLDTMFFGGVNMFLQQKAAVFRHMPRFLSRMLDSKRVLNYVSRFSGSARPEDLGSLAAEMLHGEEGKMTSELGRLVAWLRDDYKPDLIVLQQCMFLGMAKTMREEMGAAVLCALQGEDLFLDGLIEPYRSDVLSELHRRSSDVDAYVASCDYYADHMSEFLQVPRQRIEVVRLGITLDGFQEGLPPQRPEDSPFTMGYLARICPEKGLHIAIDAFLALCEKLGAGKVRFRAAGWLGERDRPFLEEQRRKVREAGLEEWWDYAGEVDRQGKIDFLRSLDALTVPTVYREPKGMFALEAMAAGVPVVQPRHGAFPEMIELTGGGILVEPQSAQAVAEGIESLMADPQRRRELGRSGQTAVRSRFQADQMTQETVEVYSKYLDLKEPIAAAGGVRALSAD